jgi:hypothetical protein
VPTAAGDAEEIERILSEELDKLRPEAILVASDVKGRKVSLQSFHAVIGGKNNVYVDSVRTQFKDSQDFIAQWTHGLIALVKGKNIRSTAAHDVARIVQDTVGREYVFKFLTRNFYRQYNARTRHKPADHLWAIWFGGRNHDYGLLIAPSRRQGEWANDKSEMRRAPYVYWTVGHVLQTGLASPDEEQPLRFSTVDELLKFYRFFLKKVSNSQYEKGIADRYMAYLLASTDVFSEPFLVPEFRYAGLAGKHEHRLDYTVFNGHTTTLTGFELSPYSTHGAIKNAKDKTQKAINEEGAANWGKEMKKRNDYFNSYQIPVVTFTDSSLTDLDECFQLMRTHLAAREPHEFRLDEALDELTSLQL